MNIFNVGVWIRYKRELRDPESEVIYRNLILKKGYTAVKKLEGGRFFNFSIQAESLDDAIRLVREMCRDLRLYNPVVHEIEVIPLGESSRS